MTKGSLSYRSHYLGNLYSHFVQFVWGFRWLLQFLLRQPKETLSFLSHWVNYIYLVLASSRDLQPACSTRWGLSSFISFSLRDSCSRPAKLICPSFTLTNGHSISSFERLPLRHLNLETGQSTVGFRLDSAADNFFNTVVETFWPMCSNRPYFFKKRCLPIRKSCHWTHRERTPNPDVESSKK